MTTTGNSTQNNLRHFKTHEEVIKYALEEIRAELQLDLAAMLGSEAEKHTDDQVASVDDRIADLDQVIDAGRWPSAGTL